MTPVPLAAIVIPTLESLPAAVISGSATNYLEIGNATADPDITAAGSDSDVGITIVAKGTGVIQITTSMNPTLTSTGKALVLGF